MYIELGLFADGFSDQFEKVNPAKFSAHGVQYDYRSVMHYGQYDGAKDSGAITIETRDKNFQVSDY